MRPSRAAATVASGSPSSTPPSAGSPRRRRSPATCAAMDSPPAGGPRPLSPPPTPPGGAPPPPAGGRGPPTRHYHPQQVFAYTISGKWGYLEHDWVATAGDFVYEAPGEAHTLVAHEHAQPMKGLLQRHRPADLARRERRSVRALRRLRHAKAMLPRLNELRANAGLAPYSSPLQ